MPRPFRPEDERDVEPRVVVERDRLDEDRLVPLLFRRVGVVCLLATVPVTLPTVTDSGAEPARIGRPRPEKRAFPSVTKRA